ncbi:hypothetical protein MMC21_003175 [Puttea exsequens]|nr:hypothetical protein [Puttea exsequens]
MAYHNQYGPRPMQYGAPAPHDAGHFSPQNMQPLQHQHQQQTQQQQQHQHQHQHQQQIHPNPYPQSQPSSQAYLDQPDQAQRQQFQPNRGNGNGSNGGGQLTHPAPTLPDDPFKKPYLPPQRASEPQQQYTQNALHIPRKSEADATAHITAQPTNAQYNHQHAQIVQDTRRSPTSSSYQSATPSVPLAASSSMTVQTVPAPSSSVSPPQSETSSQPPDSTPLPNKLSPEDQRRVDALLNVNSLLFQEICILQKSGVKPMPNPQSPQHPNPTNQASPHPKPDDKPNPSSTLTDVQSEQNPPPSSTASTPTTTTPTTTHPPTSNPLAQKKYQEYMVRLRTNLTYLITFSDASKAEMRKPYPQLLDGPSAWIGEKSEGEEKERWEELRDAYKTCRELWPDWKPQPRMIPGQQQQGQGQGQGQGHGHGVAQQLPPHSQPQAQQQ